jgi:hypothetical protein
MKMNIYKLEPDQVWSLFVGMKLQDFMSAYPPEFTKHDMCKEFAEQYDEFHDTIMEAEEVQFLYKTMMEYLKDVPRNKIPVVKIKR